MIKANVYRDGEFKFTVSGSTRDDCRRRVEAGLRKRHWVGQFLVYWSA